MSRRILITGCSGGGKSTLLDELARRGHATILEPGRRLVEAGQVLPWENPQGFAHAAAQLARNDFVHAPKGVDVFFDRGLIDAAVALLHIQARALHETLDGVAYHATVLLVPPWPEIYVQDAGRRHGIADALEEFTRIECALDTLGYDTLVLPRASVCERADWVLRRL